MVCYPDLNQLVLELVYLVGETDEVDGLGRLIRAGGGRRGNDLLEGRVAATNRIENIAFLHLVLDHLIHKLS